MTLRKACMPNPVRSLFDRVADDWRWGRTKLRHSVL